MKPLYILSSSLVLGAGLFSIPLAQADESEPKVIAHEDFTQFAPSGHWGIVDDNDFDRSLRGEDRRNAKKGFVTGEDEILFESLWTRTTLRKLYPGLWEGGKPTKDEIKALRAHLQDGCDSKLEIGKASVYLHSGDSNDYVAELDTDKRGCSLSGFEYEGEWYDPSASAGNFGTIRMGTFLPTVPGAEYQLDVLFQKREKGSAAALAGQNKLVVRLGGLGVEKFAFETMDPDVAPASSDPGIMETSVSAESPFLKGTIKFKAGRFFTRLNLRDNGDANSYGVVISDLKVLETKANDRVDGCEHYPMYSKARKACLLDDTDTGYYGCDLSSAKMTHIAGTGSPTGNPSRDMIENLLSKDGKTFLSLGKGGKVRLRMQENQVNAACPIAGKTLSFQEITFGSLNFDNYPEQGIARVKLTGCNGTVEGSAEDGWHIISGNEDDNFFKTKDSVSYDFDSAKYAGCALTHIVIKDKTDKLTSTPSTDGVDINSLMLMTTGGGEQ